MSTDPNFSTRDLSATSPQLRDDLEVHFQDGSYVLEDPINGNFFSIGAVEYRFLQLLDGQLTLGEIIGRLSVEADAEALTAEAATSLLRSLADSNLLEGGGRQHAERVRDQRYRKDDGQKMVQQGKSLLFWRIPLGNPDRVLDRILPFFSWVMSPWFFLLWCAVVVAGAISVARNWNRFGEEMSGMFEVGNLFVLGIIWILLKIFHEVWHALVCKYFGGNVPEMGMVLLLFVTPLGYVNATSATKFSSKWKRIFVSAAGIYGELFLAGLAAIVWAGLDPGILSRSLHEVIVISSVTTILFNANPLMRFDGYFILADLTGVANLYSKAQRSAGFWFRRWFLGANPKRHPVPDRDRQRWITLYGIAAFFWRIIIVAGILAFISHRWNGAGLMAGVFVGTIMLASLIQGVSRYLKKNARREEVSAIGTAFRTIILLIVLGSLLGVVHVSSWVRVPAVVDWISDGEVRVDCPGFVEQILVKNGDEVRVGDLLAVIRNHDEETQLAQLRLDLKRSQILAYQHLEAEEISSYQSEMKQFAALQVHLQGLEKYVGTLHLKATRDGVVFGRDLANIEGTFVETGQTFCSVGRDSEKRLVLAVGEDFSNVIRSSKGAVARFRARGRIDSVPATINRINPHASTRIPHFELITPAGGPLVARRTLGESDESDADTRIRGDALTRQFELAKPHFEAIALLDENPSRTLEVGEVGYLRVQGGERRSLWQLLLNSLDKAYRQADRGN